MCCVVCVLSIALVTMRRYRQHVYFVVPSAQQAPILHTSKGKSRVYTEDTVSLL